MAIWSAVGEGLLTPDEAASLSMVLGRSIQALETHDILKRLEALETDARDEQED